MTKLTPMMKQYFDIKENHKDCILFFRLGDFYEMFFDDAIVASRELEITLTSRGGGDKAPMCGVPFHSADSYIAKLVERGYKVAICEQIEDVSKAVGIVKRDVVRIITPGTITDSNLLDENTNNYLCCIYLDESCSSMGLSYTDISTGELYTTQVEEVNKDLLGIIINELAKIGPAELIVNNHFINNEDITSDIKRKFNMIINTYHDWSFQFNIAEDNIKNQFNVLSLEGLGLSNHKYSIISTGSLLEYLKETQKTSLTHINQISNYNLDTFMKLDLSTRINLELVETLRRKNRKGSLLYILDKTSTAMGARLLKKWIEEPLIDKLQIEERLDIVDYFTKEIMFMDEVEDTLKDIYDIERLIGKVAYGNCNGRDLNSLKYSISNLPHLKRLLENCNEDRLIQLGNQMDCLEDIYELINAAIVDEPPIGIKDGGLIKSNYDKELSSLRKASSEGKQWLADLEKKEKENTGIKNLKVSFNKVFGYFIEVSKSNIKLVPEYFVRKQTLANAERYITSDLKNIEDKILGAEDKMIDLEYNIFLDIRDKMRDEVERIQKISKLIATVDVLNGLSKVAYQNNYIRPIINEYGIINIKNGRHPVVEKVIENESFVPNDTYLDCNENMISMITGPNMAGKSTYMRQVALISLMAQVGSFVSADEANISIVDRIFTRIGASDDLSQGQSTFMVEMNEVANILNNGTKNSLVILDEIGRGTSTYDGLSIAWAVAEYINNTMGAKTLFATHYHELTELEDTLKGVNNYKILVEEREKSGIVFLRKIVKGRADRSYGIEVAKLAGVRDEVIKRASEVLKSIDSKDDSPSIDMLDEQIYPKAALETPLELLAINNKNEDDSLKRNSIIKSIKSLDMMNISPIEAINILHKLWQDSNDV